jgi:hypothetical protein
VQTPCHRHALLKAGTESCGPAAPKLQQKWLRHHTWHATNVPTRLKKTPWDVGLAWPQREGPCRTFSSLCGRGLFSLALNRASRQSASSCSVSSTLSTVEHNFQLSARLCSDRSMQRTPCLWQPAARGEPHAPEQLHQLRCPSVTRALMADFPEAPAQSCWLGHNR